VHATQQEFGAIGSDGSELLGGPVLDKQTRHLVHLRRFARLGFDPARLEYEDIASAEEPRSDTSGRAAA
jgi:hypothetical protein